MVRSALALAADGLPLLQHGRADDRDGLGSRTALLEKKRNTASTSRRFRAANQWAARSSTFSWIILAVLSGAGGPRETPLRPLPASLRQGRPMRSEEHTSELQSRQYLVCRLLLEKKTQAVYGVMTVFPW